MSDQPTEAERTEDFLLRMGLCPATGAEHAWTDAVGPEHEHLAPAHRWHCDDCGASPLWPVHRRAASDIGLLGDNEQE